MIDDGFFAGVFLGVLLALFLTLAYVKLSTSICDEAVKRGHAEYYLDDHNDRQWRWREIK